LKTFNLVLLSLSLVAALSACNLPGNSGVAPQTTDKNPGSSAPTITSILTQTQKVITTSTYTTSTMIASPGSTPSPLNTPAWSAYTYTCELAAGGGTMTMNLAWADRSNNEDGYRVYRDMKVIATLAPNSTSYVDVAYVATGEQLSYSVEAFNKDWKSRGSTITYGCQLLN
jgi:hypothetical protein